jgi:hypothetical protein
MLKREDDAMHYKNRQRDCDLFTVHLRNSFRFISVVFALRILLLLKRKREGKTTYEAF